MNKTKQLKKNLKFKEFLQTKNYISYKGSGSEWHSDKMIWCVYLAQRQNDTVRHFGTVCHFGTATKFLNFIFLSNFKLGLSRQFF